MTFTIRPVCHEDLPAICEWPQDEAELFYCFPKAPYPLTEDQLLEAIAQRAESSVVVQSGRPVAFANFYRWDQGGVCSIGNVIVAPSARRSGAAGFLVDHLCAVAFSKFAAAQVQISCFSLNTAGLLLYPKLGFVPFAIEERQSRAGERIALVHLRRNPPSAGQ
ncbi:MAG: GNAT family N-acetyltransferase [Pseudomonadales bacterium]|uniref:GNAT family N-acetyltransferase n=1 Tax=Stutzerimonas stutzeri TaxID=316 RepID=UPI0005359E7D|nr:GNAT family N-acetyltransferase [Stutzerimonas stutzeri]MCQ4285516.1 GNAT family N-acetyltransferase [Stutzerimonas stutzeri]BAP79422.1 acetyltransferase [Pseudomonas sp. MT-1]